MVNDLNGCKCNNMKKIDVSGLENDNPNIENKYVSERTYILSIILTFSIILTILFSILFSINLYRYIHNINNYMFIFLILSGLFIVLTIITSYFYIKSRK